MPDPIAPHAETATRGPTAAPDQQIDWEAIERSPEFRELVARRRRFVIPATIFFLAWYLGFVLLCGYAKDFMGSSVYEGLTIGYTLALSQFVMVWGLAWLYLRKADREFDPLQARLLEHVGRTDFDATGRFARTGAGAPAGKAPGDPATTTTTTTRGGVR
jgi:uncharacterized membrane protein (DUF485 family)